MVVVPYDFDSLKKKFVLGPNENLRVLSVRIGEWTDQYTSDTAGTVPSRAGIMVAILMYACDPDLVFDYARLANLSRDFMKWIIKIKSPQSLDDIFGDVPSGAFRGAKRVDDYLSVLMYYYCSPCDPRFANELKVSPGFDSATL